MKRPNSSWGCPRIAHQIALAFGVEIDKDLVRRIVASHDRLEPRSGGPSWLTFLGYMKDSLWSLDLFRVRIGDAPNPLDSRCDGSTHAAHHWVWHSLGNSRWLGALSDVQSRDSETTPLQSTSVRITIRGIDFINGRPNLRVLGVIEVKTVPSVPLSHRSWNG
jgi:putative transposase